MVTANVQFFELLYSVYLFELAFDTVIVEYIMHSDILNYTKLALNSLKMIQKDSLSANQTGDDRAAEICSSRVRLFINGPAPICQNNINECNDSFLTYCENKK